MTELLKGVLEDIFCKDHGRPANFIVRQDF
jgi:hypothetical protein